MAPQSDASDGIEVTNSNKNNDEIKLSLKDRIKNFITKSIQSLRLFIYNKEHQTIFGNTSSSWIKISIYYFFFYVCLGLYYSGIVGVFGAIISRESPRYLYHNSQMNDNGQVHIGMGFRPMSDITSVSISIYNDTTSQNNAVSSLTNYQYAFLTQDDPTYIQECSPTQPASQLPEGRSCQFSWTDIVTSEAHPCSTTNVYGWPVGQPCILVKLNKIYGWVPTTGNIIDQVANATGQPVLPVDQREDNIYITCDGKGASDKNVLGNMTYYSLLHPLGNPNYGGIPYYFFPYRNSREHVQPFVLVQFTLLPLDHTVTVECRAWAPNIQQLSQGTTNRGMIIFTLYKSNKPAPIKP